MANSQEDKLYKSEYAKSGRASCKKCKENIAKESLRMAIMVQSPMFDGKVPHWHHFSCFWQRARVLSHGDIDGFSDLRWEDQEKIKKAIETGGVTAGGKGDKEGSGKAEKTLNDFAVEYAKSNRSTCKGCEQKIDKEQIRVSKKMVDPEKPQLGMIDRWYHTGCFISRREELGFMPAYNASQLKGFSSLKAEDKEELNKRLPAVKSEGKRKADEVDGDATKKKKQKKADKEEKQLEKQLKDQSQLIWNIKDELKKCSSTNDMKELLIANKQEVPSGESAILDRISDCMAFGALKPCEECQGQLVFKSDAYYCTGNITAWTKCVFKTQTPNRKDWVIPKEFHEIPYLKKFKFKRQDRIFSPTPVSPPPTTTNSSAPSLGAAPVPEAQRTGCRQKPGCAGSLTQAALARMPDGDKAPLLDTQITPGISSVPRWMRFCKAVNARGNPLRSWFACFPCDNLQYINQRQTGALGPSSLKDRQSCAHCQRRFSGLANGLLLRRP
ncbi:UNVERIFIED_CONTAM: hypothetical protein FKN15_041980 [Acipenser sinensis]